MTIFFKKGRLFLAHRKLSHPLFEQCGGKLLADMFNARSNNFFIYIFIKETNFPSDHMIITIKPRWKHI